MWSNLLYPPNLIFYLVTLALVIWTVFRGSPGQKVTGIVMMLNAVAVHTEIPLADSMTKGMLTDLALFAVLTTVACWTGSTWSLVASGLIFNALVVSTAGWIGQGLGTGVHQAVIATLNMVWYYMAFGAIGYGMAQVEMRARRNAEGAASAPDQPGIGPSPGLFTERVAA